MDWIEAPRKDGSEEGPRFIRPSSISAIYVCDLINDRYGVCATLTSGAYFILATFTERTEAEEYTRSFAAMLAENGVQ